MGMAPVAHVLFNKFMTFNPKNPEWVNRDRFVLSYVARISYSMTPHTDEFQWNVVHCALSPRARPISADLRHMLYGIAFLSCLLSLSYLRLEHACSDVSALFR